MGFEQQSDLSPADRDAFLGRHETGVLALASGDEPYAIPVSYGYDASDQQFYLQLVSTPDSEKRRFLDGEPRARLVVYDRQGAAYQSVVAVGTLQPVPRSALTAADIQGFSEARRPLIDVWGDAEGDVEVKLFRLDPADLSAREIRIATRDESS